MFSCSICKKNVFSLKQFSISHTYTALLCVQFVITTRQKKGEGGGGFIGFTKETKLKEPNTPSTRNLQTKLKSVCAHVFATLGFIPFHFSS